MYKFSIKYLNMYYSEDFGEENYGTFIDTYKEENLSDVGFFASDLENYKNHIVTELFIKTKSSLPFLYLAKPEKIALEWWNIDG